MFSVDYTITIGNIIEIAAFLGGGLFAFFTMRADINVIRNDVGYLQRSFERLSAILTQVAVQDARISMIEKDVDEMRHGQGYIQKSNG